MRATTVLGIIFVIACATLARSQSLDLQATCATQARKAFQEWENEWRTGPFGRGYTTVSSDYQSHYNTKIKKCLLLIEATRMLGKNQISTFVNLIDAYERRPYASYVWSTRENKKYWEVPPTVCELTPSLRKKTDCTTREEFDAFVAEYMED
jgi:hypothetical protein